MIDCVRAIFTTPLTPELVAHYEQLIAQLEELGRPSLMAVACLAYGSIRFASGDVERGLQLTDSALTHAERAGYLIDTGIQAECAPIYLLADETNTATAMLQRNLPVNKDSDQTILTAQDVALVALIAANDDHLVAAATLTRAARHHLDTLGITGSGPTKAVSGKGGSDHRQCLVGPRRCAHPRRNDDCRRDGPRDNTGPRLAPPHRRRQLSPDCATMPQAWAGPTRLISEMHRYPTDALAGC